MDELSLSRNEVRRLDAVAIQELGVEGLVLMENAARGICDEILGEGKPGTIHILCGPGNNGGDGFALARQLAANGVASTVWLFSSGKSLTRDSECNRRAWLACGGSIKVDSSLEPLHRQLQMLKPTDLVVDCLLGTGVRGAPRAPFAEVIVAVNQSPAGVLAVDLPSGLDCDSGQAAGECICASRTVTFVAVKNGFQAADAAPYTGRVSVAHIGLPLAWVKDWVAGYRSASGEAG